jgi:uncharacterized protein (DUF983 family)
MSEKQKTTANGISFLSLLAILFIGLKLTNQIDWSWWWVLSPLWMPFAVGLPVAIIVAVITDRT